MSLPSQLLPVNQAVFQAVSAVNGSFEKLRSDLQALQQFSFFPGERINDRLNTIALIRAEINLMLIEALQHRETSNASYYDSLCIHREKELTPPDDVFMDAEQRRMEIAERQRLMEQDEEENEGRREGKNENEGGTENPA